MTVLDRPVVLPKMAFLSAWGMVEVGDLPPAMGTNLHYWTTPEARRTLETRVLDTLTSLGLARNGRLNTLWRNTLALLGCPDREYYAFTNFPGGESCSVLVASGGGDALRAIISDDVIALEPLEDRWHATALVDVLPDVPGAAVRPVTMAKGFYEDPHAGPRDIFADPVDTRDRDHLVEVMRRDRAAVHQLYTARREDRHRVRSSPITAIDLAEDGGRVLTYATGDEQIVMEPGTPRGVVQTLNNTMNGLDDD
ncbi:ESX secretion-associated protein EspG [Amycolatopsis sp. NBC_00345]|uniref:ESX secretion-associated protein EspG n=1 Tax=Amycolatopsis sp. NBC_00345 TaxID=2975955 RepID=UPI002E253FFF